MTTPCDPRDRQYLAPGAWTEPGDPDTLHIDPGAMLRAAGFEDTPTNRQQIERAAAAILPGGTVEVDA